ncbi:hypothetical protein BWQ96_07591 [Gracilariopsis chorda]|uniref:Wings apart-like protein C-terminal domain-containing protein n=1 Tax=Gracilariopsis chorda TaxID=448386 RepID=A0A2V3IKR9_9FLOR|nr:hypothetical protein BWQ96_07591 [Gracilariopsis chorda]|eukprot:PXF42648.1 hypothetical protein BWQ96_07591 [Gracilariopsis chorda]
MPRKSTKKRGKSAEQNAFEFTGEEAVQADKEARARPTFKRQKISILSTLPDATQRLAALAKKPFFCTRTDEQDDGQKTTLESKRESKPRLERRSVSYHGPKIQKNYASLDTQKFMNRKTRQSVNRRASTESVVTPPIKREVTPDPPTMPGGTQESSEASSAPRRSGRKRFRTTKAYLAYEDARRHIGGKKRVRTTEQEGVRNNRTLSKRENTPKSAGVERVSKGKEALASQSSKMIEPMPMEPVNDKPKTGGGGEDGDIEIPRTKPSEHTAGTNSEESGKGTRVQTQNNFASVARKRDGRETSAAVKTEHSANVFTDAHQRPSSVHGTAQDPEHVGHKKSNMALKKAIGTDKDQQQGSTTRGVEVHGTAVIKQVSPTCLGPGSDLPLSGACTDNQEQIQRSQAFVDIEDQESEPGKHAKSNSGGDSEADTKLDQLRGKSDPHAEHQNISDDSLIESPVTPVNSRKDPAEVAKAHVQTLNIHAENSGTKDEKSVSAVALVNRRLSLDAGEMESQDRKAENREGETSQSRKENAQRPGSECMSSPKMVKRDRETRLSTSEICKLSSTKDGEVRHNSPCEEKIGGFDPDVSVSVDEPQDSKGMEPDTLGSDLSENKGYPSLKMMNSKTATRSKGPGEKSKSTLSLSRQLGTDKSISESDRRRTQVNTVVPEIVTEVLNNCTSAAKKDATSKNTEILARGQEKDSPLCSVWDSYVLADPSVNALQQNTERQDPSQETVNPTTREETCIEPTGPSSLNSGGKQQITERANVPFKTVPDETMKASQKPQAAVQHVEKTKQTFSKRVRFLEPDASTLSRDSRRDLSGILKMKLRKARRRQVSFIDGPDVSVMTGHATEPNGKEERMLLDELQYLLDGIFKPSGNSGKKSPQLESQLIAKTLVSLISLLKRKPHQKMSKEGGEHESAMIQILLKQPSLFKTIVGKLCSVFGKSRSVDAVLAVVFVLIFRETPKLRLIEAPELDILLNAFFRSSAAALKDDDVGNTSKSQSKEGAAPDVKRRRGRLAKRFEETNTDDSFLSTLNKVVSEASIIEDDFNGFKGETVGAAHLIGIAISLILCFDSKLRLWMRENRRLDRIVAVLYSCEKVMLQKTSPASEQRRLQFTNKEVSTPWIVLGASLRVLEFTVLDEVCQSRTARESRLCAIVVDVIRGVHQVNEGPFGGEWILSAALRVAINLCHGFGEASRQFVQKGGHKLALMWVVKECNAAGLLTSGVEGLKENDCEQSFDVRVLCLALLATIVDQEEHICNVFHTMNVPGLKKRKAGGLEIVLEILQAAEAVVERSEEEFVTNHNLSELKPRRGDIQTDEHCEKSELVMETKITIGYASLLLGALVRDNVQNRKIAEDLIPSHNLVGVAAVLTEFLEFHHEVGIISGSMDRMYARIISSLVKPFQAAESGRLAGDVQRLSVADEGNTTPDEKQRFDREAQMIS